MYHKYEEHFPGPHPFLKRYICECFLVFKSLSRVVDEYDLEALDDIDQIHR